MSSIGNGLALLAIGMVVVLSFLALLILLMSIMSKIILWLNKIFPESIEEIKTTARKVSSNIDEAIAVAIAAIIAKRN